MRLEDSAKATRLMFLNLFRDVPADASLTDVDFEKMKQHLLLVSESLSHQRRTPVSVVEFTNALFQAKIDVLEEEWAAVRGGEVKAAV